MDTFFTKNPDIRQQLEKLSIRQNDEVKQTTHSELIGDQVQINVLDLHIQQEQVIEAQGPATLCIAVFLQGSAELSIDGGKPLKIEPGMTVVFHAPKPISGRTIFHTGSRIHCLDLRYSLEYLRGFGIDSLDKIIPMFQHDHSVSDTVMVARPTSAIMLQLAKQILDCDMQGLARDIFLQAKSLEALAQILSILSGQQRSNQLKLSKIDLQRVQQAIRLVDLNYQEPWTISRLARAVGINERKLKTGFHQLVQSTVHNYLEQIRLSNAQSLLSSGVKITDVSLAVGYSNPSHFARRFKQHYKQSPSQWLTSHN